MKNGGSFFFFSLLRLERKFRTVLPNLFLASAPFSDKKIYIAPLPSLAHISTQLFRILCLGCLKMIKTRMGAKMHFTIKFSKFNSFSSRKLLELMIWNLLEFMKGSISFEQHYTWTRR